MNNKALLILVGFIFLSAGVLTGVYSLINDTQKQKTENYQEKILEGEELLKQNNSYSSGKALSIFSELSAKKLNAEDKFRVRFGLAYALEKNQDRIPALEIYKELSRFSNLKPEDKDKVSYSLGNLLLKLDQEEEGRSHIDSVLKSSSDKPLRSKALTSVGDFHFRKSNYEQSRRNYMLAIEEDPTNISARTGLARSLAKLGKEWAYYDVLGDYIDGTSYLEEEPKAKSIKKAIKSNDFEKGRALFQKKQYAKSIPHFQKALKSGLKSKEEEAALHYLAQANYATGNYTEADRFIDLLLVNADSTYDQSAVFLRGLILFSTKKYERAITAFQDAMDKYPKSPITQKASDYRLEAQKLLLEDKEFKPSKDKKENGKSNPGKKEENKEEEVEEDNE